MVNTRIRKVAAIIVGVFGLVAVTACSSAASTNNPSTTSTSGASPITQSTLGSITPSGPVQVGSVWMVTVHSARAYPNQWNAPTGMHGSWGHMGRGYMAVVLDVSAQSSATPLPSDGATYAGPVCALRGGWGMMGTMVGDGDYGWQMMSPGLYRGPMAYMASTSLRQFTLVCTDRASGDQASWTIGF